MNKLIQISTIVLCLIISQLPSTVAAQTEKQKPPLLKIAVSANFSHTLAKLLPQFEADTGIKTQVFIGSTGSLFLQLSHGAAYDIFLAADTLRPKRLVEDNLALPNSLKTYAFGQISFWSSTWNNSENLPSLAALLQQLHNDKPRLAIANPNIAPYGVAAKQMLKHNHLWKSLSTNRLITGSNINQTFQQVRSGAVSLGVVANSQLIENNLTGIAIPTSTYQVIEQQLVIINSSKLKQQAQALSQYLLSENSQALIEHNGYYGVNHTLTSSAH
ncbi:molybdate ABC transporter substrate-binding protein [Colwelliaceae bacterium 6441]